jgi:hypothetical protein
VNVLTTGERRRWWLGPEVLIAALLSAGILYYSQTPTLDWDEGFHLVAASLIAAGKRPFIDFCFPQPPLHAWWNAFWLSTTGFGWRVPQAVAALLTCGAVGMTADFVARRCSHAAGCVAALLVGLNELTVEFGTKAQAYGACVFLTVAAFRATVGRRPALAGFLACLATGCSLLAAPVCLVLLVWHVIRRRWAFLAGMLPALLPFAISFLRAPYPTWFNLVQFHTSFRDAGWGATIQHDVEVLTGLADSGPALLLVLLAIAGLCFLRKEAEPRAEFHLAAWVAAALAAEAAVAHPTFPQYFICTVPFLAMLAAVGFTEVSARLSLPARWGLPALALILFLSLNRSLLEMKDDNNSWTNMDALARKIAEVTPANGQVLADPPVYFALHHPPPSGMEFPASHAVKLPAAKLAELHIVSQAELERRVHAGEFATAETCKGDEEEIKALELPKLYAQSYTIAGCTVYWGMASHVLSYK